MEHEKAELEAKAANDKARNQLFSQLQQLLAKINTVKQLESQQKSMMTKQKMELDQMMVTTLRHCSLSPSLRVLKEESEETVETEILFSSCMLLSPTYSLHEVKKRIDQKEKMFKKMMESMNK
eukprot:1360175-Amorphochlora_amoeboformis.AAC.2